jgi:hypothetical protein
VFLESIKGEDRDVGETMEALVMEDGGSESEKRGFDGDEDCGEVEIKKTKMGK